jgi:hypothetical protein
MSHVLDAYSWAWSHVVDAYSWAWLTAFVVLKRYWLHLAVGCHVTTWLQIMLRSIAALPSHRNGLAVLRTVVTTGMSLNWDTVCACMCHAMESF